MKLRPIEPLQTTCAALPQEDIVSLATPVTVISVSRIWSPDKNTIVEFEVKYSSACCVYSESVAQYE